MRFNLKTIYISLVLALFFFSCASILHAQTSRDAIDRLEAEMDQILKDLKPLNAERGRLKGEAASLSRDVALLDLQIKEAQLKIKAHNLTIERLSKDIGVKSQTIGELEAKIERGHESLAELVRKRNEKDSISIAEIVLSKEQFSDFFGEVDEYQTVSGALKVTLDDVRAYKSTTEVEKGNLEDKKAKETNARKAIEGEKRTIESAQKEKNRLLSVTKGQEKAYAQVIADKEKRVAQIRAALFELRGGEGIPFGQAYDFAVEASKVTGVRPAFLLAIFKQESDIGKNVGNCLVKNLKTGDGVGANTGTPFKGIMHPTRDLPVFVAITNALGLDTASMRVSCPLSYGWGGAMGPAQFIPSTWKLFERRIASSLGISIPNPWEPEHAFMASSLYLSDLGAGLQTYTAERNAACRYYSGAACGIRPGATSYGDSVMALAVNIQENMINPILGQY